MASPRTNRRQLFSALYINCEEMAQINLRAIPLRPERDKVVNAEIEIGDFKKIEDFCRRYDNDNFLGCYFAIATRNGGRSKDHIDEIPSLWADIDFKDSSEDHARQILKNFYFQPSAIVSSGGGLQAYWFLKEIATEDEIPQIEDALKRLANVLEADLHSAEAARILRIPGTHNRKPEYGSPRLVALEYCNAEKRYNYEEFLDFLPPATPIIQHDTHADYSSNHSENIQRIMKCEFMQHCEVDRAMLPEPLWYFMVSQLARIPGGRQKIHQLSREYPGYSTKETDSKILHAISRSGPHTCDYIKQHWDCGRNCGVGSPSALAYRKAVGSYTNESGDRHAKTSDDSKNRAGQASLASRIREWIEESSGEFLVTQLDREFDLKRSEKRNRSNILGRLVKEGVLRRVGYGRYRRVDTDCQAIDWRNATTEIFTIRWPLEIEKFVQVQPGDVVVIAGETNAGKTTFLVNLLNLNRRRRGGRKIHYFSSEMGAADLKQRIERFQEPLVTFDFRFYERGGNYADVIRPNDINIIDYLEMSDNFYQVGGHIREIHAQLKTGIAIIAIQKKIGADIGRGGEFSMEKSSLYLTLSQHRDKLGRPAGQEIRILKGKKWAGNRNPNGFRRRFKIIGGSLIRPTVRWFRDRIHTIVELEDD